MVLCEASAYFGESLVGIWLIMTITMLMLIFVSSGPVFYYFYWPSKVTFKKWQYKVKLASISLDFMI